MWKRKEKGSWTFNKGISKSMAMQGNVLEEAHVILDDTQGAEHRDMLQKRWRTMTGHHLRNKNARVRQRRERERERERARASRESSSSERERVDVIPIADRSRATHDDAGLELTAAHPTMQPKANQLVQASEDAEGGLALTRNTGSSQRSRRKSRASKSS